MANPPLITRQGIKTFDKQIDGQRGDGVLLSTPTPMGLFQKLVGVSWPSGLLVYAATSIHGDTNNTHATIAASSDGITWQEAAHYTNAGAICGIAGATDTDTILLVGGYYQQDFPTPSGSATLMFPQFYASADKGKTWDVFRPSWNTSATFALTGNTFTAGYVSGVGYNPDTKTFYAAIIRHKSTAPSSFEIDQVFYSGGDGTNFTEQSSQTMATDPGFSLNYQQAPWPAGTLVNDSPAAQDAENNRLRYASSPSPSVKYAAVNVDPQEMVRGSAFLDMTSSNTLSSTIGGVGALSPSGTLAKSFLVYINASGAVVSVPSDPTSTQGGSKDFGAGFTMDPTLDNFTLSMRTLSDGTIFSIDSSLNEYATVSFSGSGGN